MAYLGPERRQAEIQNQQSPANYDREYRFAALAAIDWPPDELSARLCMLLRATPHREDIWGTIDAFTDLLSKHTSPVWTAG